MSPGGLVVVWGGGRGRAREGGAREERPRCRLHLFLAAVSSSQAALGEGRGVGCPPQQPGAGNLPSASFPSFPLVRGRTESLGSGGALGALLAVGTSSTSSPVPLRRFGGKQQNLPRHFVMLSDRQTAGN